MNSTKAGEHPVTTVAPSEAASSASQRPEFFRLPKSGGDPYFGFGRSYYYEGEQRGYWRLVRIRDRGKLRGITLVPYDAVSSFVRSQAERSHPETGRKAEVK
jgi:hypothetical protein